MFREMIEVIKENNQKQISNGFNNAKDVTSKPDECGTELLNRMEQISGKNSNLFRKQRNVFYMLNKRLKIMGGKLSGRSNLFS